MAVKNKQYLRTNKKHIEIKNVGKVFKGRRKTVEALKNITFDVGKDEFVTIVGPSGCGKSTLLRLIMGTVPPTSGEITVDGKKGRPTPTEMCLIFQYPNLMMWRTVMQNLMVPIEVLGLEREKYEKEAHSLLKLVGLEGFENCYPEELSGGMQSRVAVCRGLIYDPTVVMMDEPFGPLDALTRRVMDIELLRIWREKRKTILFVTHDVDEAVLLSDRVVVMSNRPGTIKDIVKIDLPHPRNLKMMNSNKFRVKAQYILDLLGVKMD